MSLFEEINGPYAREQFMRIFGYDPVTGEDHDSDSTTKPHLKSQVQGDASANSSRHCGL